MRYRGVAGWSVVLISAAAIAALAQGRQGQPAAPAVPATVIEKGDFKFSYDSRGVSSIAHAQDPFGAKLTTAAPLGLTLAYRATGDADWSTVTRGPMTASAAAGSVTYTSAPGAPLRVVETYKTDGTTLDWTIDLEAAKAVTVGDLGISIPNQGTNGATPADIFERGFLKHQFVSGAGSFFFYVRASGAPPFLLVTIKPGTKLEFTGAGGGRGGGGAQVYVHSARASAQQPLGTWRQANTSLELAAGKKASYGFRMQWALTCTTGP